MTSRLRILTTVTAMFAGVMLAGAASPAAAQSGGLLEGLFGGGQSSRQGERQDQQQEQMAQVSGSDILMRLDRLEGQIRQLTGTVEQLQYRNQQLEQQLQRAQGDADYRAQESGATGPRGTRAPQAAPGAGQAPGVAPSRIPQTPPAGSPSPSQRRSDAFDPSQTPEAPGAPRTLGSARSASVAAVRDGEIGAPGGRAAGAPLDLSTLAGAAAADPSLQGQSSSGMQVAAVEPPTQSPKDHFDLAYGYILQREYALAEQTFRSYLERYANDSRGRRAEAEYWLGESFFQRQRYQDAAKSFLTFSTNYETEAKAPDSLLRLGQSLAALGEKETACATFTEVSRKYPKASVNVRQGAERELKRVRC